jgi:soluble lytic murein transglycosylase-like protein
MRGFALLLVVLLVASYAVGLLRPAVAGESDEFRAVASAAPSNVPDTDVICNALAAAAQENDLPIDFFTRLIWQESRFDPTAVHRRPAHPRRCPRTSGLREDHIREYGRLSRWLA